LKEIDNLYRSARTKTIFIFFIFKSSASIEQDEANNDQMKTEFPHSYYNSMLLSSDVKTVLFSHPYVRQQNPDISGYPF